MRLIRHKQKIQEPFIAFFKTYSSSFFRNLYKRTEGIQKNEENLGSDEKELLLQETIDGLNAKIFQIQSDHEKELEMIMVN